MLKFVVNNLWKTSAHNWLKIASSFTQLSNFVKLVLQNMWKRLILPPIIREYSPAKFTIQETILTSDLVKLFHNFHITYGDDYDILIRKEQI